MFLPKQHKYHFKNFQKRKLWAGFRAMLFLHKFKLVLKQLCYEPTDIFLLNPTDIFKIYKNVSIADYTKIYQKQKLSPTNV